MCSVVNYSVFVNIQLYSCWNGLYYHLIALFIEEYPLIILNKLRWDRKTTKIVAFFYKLCWSPFVNRIVIEIVIKLSLLAWCHCYSQIPKLKYYKLYVFYTQLCGGISVIHCLPLQLIQKQSFKLNIHFITQTCIYIFMTIIYIFTLWY